MSRRRKQLEAKMCTVDFYRAQELQVNAGLIGFGLGVLSTVIVGAIIWFVFR